MSHWHGNNFSTPEQQALVVYDFRIGRNMLFWRRASVPGNWPHDAMGYTLLAKAMLRVGQALFPDWTGDEPGDFLMPNLDGSQRPYVEAGGVEGFAVGLLHHFRPDLEIHKRRGSVLTGVLTEDDWHEAERLFRQHMVARRAHASALMLQLHDRLCEALAEGHLVAAIRHDAGFRDLEKSEWIDERIGTRRLLESQCDPNDPAKIHFPQNALEVAVAEQNGWGGSPLYPGNAWLFVSKESLENFIAGISPVESSLPTRREPRAFSEAALKAAYNKFVAENPHAGREEWVTAARAEFSVSVPAARKVWADNSPVGGRKSGPKATRH